MKDYSALPATMDDSEIASLVLELIEGAHQDPTVDDVDVAQGLIELVDRQALNYRPFSEEVAERIQGWVESVWAEKDLNLIDALCTVIASVQNDRGYKLLEASSRSSNPEVQALAAETLRDMRPPAQPHG